MHGVDELLNHVSRVEGKLLYRRSCQFMEVAAGYVYARFPWVYNLFINYYREGTTKRICRKGSSHVRGIS